MKWFALWVEEISVFSHTYYLTSLFWLIWNWQPYSDRHSPHLLSMCQCVHLINEIFIACVDWIWVPSAILIWNITPPISFAFSIVRFWIQSVSVSVRNLAGMCMYIVWNVNAWRRHKVNAGKQNILCCKCDDDSYNYFRTEFNRAAVNKWQIKRSWPTNFPFIDYLSLLTSISSSFLAIQNVFIDSFLSLLSFFFVP